MRTPQSHSIQARLLNYSRERQVNHNHTLAREIRAILKSHERRVGGAVPFGYDADPREGEKS